MGRQQLLLRADLGKTFSLGMASWSEAMGVPGTFTSLEANLSSDLRSFALAEGPSLDSTIMGTHALECLG